MAVAKVSISMWVQWATILLTSSEFEKKTKKSDMVLSLPVTFPNQGTAEGDALVLGTPKFPSTYEVDGLQKPPFHRCTQDLLVSELGQYSSSSTFIRVPQLWQDILDLLYLHMQHSNPC
ncbi:hypothetical protein Nepgr_030630 [Nepenthes gracilis]|uniref:Uncharacterized protein n=1 Tax=Nepenthes gracilis TaxID=150966 RepID=A0AAD3THC5_NEPGR|nr:hypothetical protein Nepgr_030630 [Nepenthes gracilis]